jgi:hypothetical protein
MEPKALFRGHILLLGNVIVFVDILKRLNNETALPGKAGSNFQKFTPSVSVISGAR